MKKIGISIQNGLLAEGIIRMLHKNGEFQPFRITSPKKERRRQQLSAARRRYSAGGGILCQRSNH